MKIHSFILTFTAVMSIFISGIATAGTPTATDWGKKGVQISAQNPIKYFFSNGNAKNSCDYAGGYYLCYVGSTSQGSKTNLAYLYGPCTPGKPKTRTNTNGKMTCK